MGVKETLYVIVAGGGDVCMCLVHINTIEVIEEAKVFEGWGGLREQLEFFSNNSINFLCDVFGVACKGEIINLAEEVDQVATVVGGINGFVVGGGAEVEFIGVQDGVDMNFP